MKSSPHTSTHTHHHHEHHDDHSHSVTNYGRAFSIGIILNVAFILVEILFGFHIDSLALLADAGHNAADVLGLGLAWGAVTLAKRQPDTHYTYGLQSSSILAALANAVLLLVACGSIGIEAVQRFSTPYTTQGNVIMAVAAMGIAVNGITAWLFMQGNTHDVNIRAAFAHMAADALVSFGVLISGAVIIYTGWIWMDPLVSLIIAVLIVAGTWSLLRESFDLALHATPKHIDTAQVQNYLEQLPEVLHVHDLHIWAMSTNETALSVHLVMKNAQHPGDAFLKHTVNELEKQFRIGHSTLQLEIGDDGAPCSLVSLHSVSSGS